MARVFKQILIVESKNNNVGILESKKNVKMYLNRVNLTEKVSKADVVEVQSSGGEWYACVRRMYTFKL